MDCLQFHFVWTYRYMFDSDERRTHTTSAHNITLYNWTIDWTQKPVIFSYVQCSKPIGQFFVIHDTKQNIIASGEFYYIRNRTTLKQQQITSHINESQKILSSKMAIL